MLTDEQLQTRKSGIGGSDAAAIMGYSHWKTPYKVWSEKLSYKQAPLSFDAQDILNRGQELEPLVKRLFEIQTGKKVLTPAQTLRHPEYPFMIANLDGCLPEEKAIVEFKTCSVFRKKEFGEMLSDDIPYDYLFQVHHYLLVSNMNVAYVAVLFADDKLGFPLLRSLVKEYGVEKACSHLLDTSYDFMIFKVSRSERLEAFLLRQCERFWNYHVLKGERPPLETLEEAKKAFMPLKEGKKVVGDSQCSQLKNLIAEDALKLKEIQRHKDELEMKLREKLGDAEELIDDKGEMICRVKVYTREMFDAPLLKKTNPAVYGAFLKFSTINRLFL